MSSGQPLNEHIETARNDIERVSAGLWTFIPELMSPLSTSDNSCY